MGIAREIMAIRQAGDRNTAATERLADGMRHLADALKEELPLLLGLHADKEFRNEAKERGLHSGNVV